MRIGVDFDNTIAGYDRLFETLATELGLLRPGAPSSGAPSSGAPSSGAIRGKTAVRDAVRLLPDGENHWQRMQALAYGPRIGGAELLPGVAEFFRRCRDAGLPVAVVSHKTRFAAGGQGETDLREAAIGFLRGHGFFGPAGLGLDEALVFFEPTREAKVARIRELGCTHFIDDLPEVFAHEDFPQGVERLLLAPAPQRDAQPGVRAFVDWRAVMGYVFGDAHQHP